MTAAGGGGRDAQKDVQKKVQKEAHKDTWKDSQKKEAQKAGRETLAGPMPEPVRQRVMSLAADGLGALPPDEVPAQLRAFARFTPLRRAKLAATPIAAALESDPGFRQRIAQRVRQGVPDLAAALDTGTVPAAADPFDVAAVAYLLRPVGWSALVEQAGREVEQARARNASAEVADTVARLREELSSTRVAARTEADRLRAERDAARREAEEARKALRAAKDALRRAEAVAREVEVAAEGERSAASTAAAGAEADLRRLRGRLAEAEAALEASRRAAREGRSMAEVRVRLLLDTVLEAAQGLRRELAIPPLTSRPADVVDAVRPGVASVGDVARRGHASDDPALLDQLLALPRVHLVVDGYNVTKTGYGDLTLAEQRLRLLGGLAVLKAQTGAEVTCVFDGAQLQSPVVLAAPRGVRVLFSPPEETADEVIRRLVRAEPGGRPVVVVSSDREVADGVQAAGARPVSSALLLRRLARG